MYDYINIEEGKPIFKVKRGPDRGSVEPIFLLTNLNINLDTHFNKSKKFFIIQQDMFWFAYKECKKVHYI